MGYNMAEDLHNMRIALLVATGFEEVELTEPREALEAAGAKTMVVSQESGMVRSWDRNDWGASYPVENILAEVIVDDFDALVLPGGVMNPDFLRIDEEAVRFVRAFFDDQKPVAAICHGPWTLIEAGVVEGRRMTSYPSIKTDLRNAGANWVDEPVVSDGNLVTSRKPDDIPPFSQAMIELFAASYEPAAA